MSLVLGGEGGMGLTRGRIEEVHEEEVEGRRGEGGVGMEVGRGGKDDCILDVLQWVWIGVGCWLRLGM